MIRTSQTTKLPICNRNCILTVINSKNICTFSVFFSMSGYNWRWNTVFIKLSSLSVKRLFLKGKKRMSHVKTYLQFGNRMSFYVRKCFLMWNRVKQNKSLTKFSFSNSLINISYLLTEYQGIPWNTEVLKHRPSLQGSWVKTERLVFHGMAWAIRLINSLLHGKNENISKLTENLPTIFRKIIFHEISTKSFSQSFSWFSILRKFYENSTSISRKTISHKFCKSIFPSSMTFRGFPTILRQFWSTCLMALSCPLTPIKIARKKARMSYQIINWGFIDIIINHTIDPFTKRYKPVENASVIIFSLVKFMLLKSW